MSYDVTTTGLWVESVGTSVMWLALLLRAPSAIRSPQQRGLWIAVAAAAVTMTLKRHFLVELVDRDFHIYQAYVLATHLCGVLSAIIVMDFVLVTTDRQQREWLHFGSGLAIVCLIILGARWNPGMNVHQSLGTGSDVFWLIVIGIHQAGNILCIAVCLRHWREDEKSPLRTTMGLFGLGSCLAALSWVGCLIRLMTGVSWVTPTLPFVMGVFCLCRAAVIAAPAFSTIRRAHRDARDFWRLWRLWRDLVSAVPWVALAPPRPRLLELLLPRGPWSLLVYRQVIEIRDAILVLRDYASPDPPFPDPGPTAAPDLSAAYAAEMARWLAAARRAKNRGQGPRTRAVGLSALGGHDLVHETAFLIRVADAYSRGAPGGDAGRPAHRFPTGIR
ncbi:MAB_1171c family putative transporter [Streptomyces sp. NPDC014991]|uniref:MAB_1171c family putative transporter n=1 Tax=Streptomyces sp. NPDC014991 TaxID=3364935 RepID=UPI0036F9144A